MILREKTGSSERKSYPRANLSTANVMWTARFPFREFQMGFFGGQSGTLTPSSSITVNATGVLISP